MKIYFTHFEMSNQVGGARAEDLPSHLQSESVCLRYSTTGNRSYIIIIMIIIIMIITLCLEDNIFGMYASLTYGPQLQRKACH